MAGPAATAEDSEAGSRPPQPHVQPRKLGGVAGIELGGGVQLGMALLRDMSPDSQDMPQTTTRHQNTCNFISTVNT